MSYNANLNSGYYYSLQQALPNTSPQQPYNPNIMMPVTFSCSNTDQRQYIPLTTTSPSLSRFQPIAVNLITPPPPPSTQFHSYVLQSQDSYFNRYSITPYSSENFYPYNTMSLPFYGVSPLEQNLIPITHVSNLANGSLVAQNVIPPPHVSNVANRILVDQNLIPPPNVSNLVNGSLFYQNVILPPHVSNGANTSFVYQNVIPPPHVSNLENVSNGANTNLADQNVIPPPHVSNLENESLVDQNVIPPLNVSNGANTSLVDQNVIPPPHVSNLENESSVEQNVIPPPHVSNGANTSFVYQNVIPPPHVSNLENESSVEQNVIPPPHVSNGANGSLVEPNLNLSPDAWNLANEIFFDQMQNTNNSSVQYQQNSPDSRRIQNPHRYEPYPHPGLHASLSNIQPSLNNPPSPVKEKNKRTIIYKIQTYISHYRERKVITKGTFKLIERLINQVNRKGTSINKINLTPERYGAISEILVKIKEWKLVKTMKITAEKEAQFRLDCDKAKEICDMKAPTIELNEPIEPSQDNIIKLIEQLHDFKLQATLNVNINIQQSLYEVALQLLDLLLDDSQEAADMLSEKLRLALYREFKDLEMNSNKILNYSITAWYSSRISEFLARFRHWDPEQSLQSSLQPMSLSEDIFLGDGNQDVMSLSNDNNAIDNNNYEAENNEHLLSMFTGENWEEDKT